MTIVLQAADTHPSRCYGLSLDDVAALVRLAGAIWPDQMIWSLDLSRDAAGRDDDMPFAAAIPGALPRVRRWCCPANTTGLAIP